MAKLRVTNLKAVQSNVRKEITKAARAKEIRQGLGEIIVDHIRDNPLGSASPVTQDFREFYEQFNKTHPKYRRPQINITFTGELLEDLKNNVKVDTTSGEVKYIIEQSNKKHKNYRSGAGKKEDDFFKTKKVEVTSLKTRKTRSVELQKTHKQIGRYVEKKGYDYLTFDLKLLDKVLNFVSNSITKVILEKFKK